ncbi:PRC-barrel domain-containing protein [Sphingopyxis sp. KK2]|uniref:PRC-barrel domain-containing protein n=1 Tax=Sphingopyxis sp. KK2 TaxID=1855727 RepID=UPI00097E5B8C|nr:PRC-barrel domain-containing protein [Sphingopyxis sp. KK2]
MEEAAGLIAPAATMIAAMMTAANLGARITGWGFVVFTLGSLAWSAVGFSSGQTNLLATNLFLTLVNLVGIWRWLGRQREYEDGARRAAKRSRTAASPSLFAASAFGGLPVSDIRGEAIGQAVDAMIECESGCLSYVVVASGGIGGIDETLRAVPAAMLDCHADGLVLLMSAAEYEKRDALDGAAWPARPPRGREVMGASAGASAAAAGERPRDADEETAYVAAQG